ncbi:MAG TPA: alpha/beta fold hydrolase [Vicinamibacterales bacterium]|nr:alpha/beta fold hydrolase [Vicinamibacterales bacterium]
MRAIRALLVAAAAVVVLFVAAGELVAPRIAAGALLHPARHRLRRDPPGRCAAETFAGAGVPLAGWRCQAVGTPRATVVYLHGVADNRGSAAGWIDRLTPRGFDVVAYDSRAHGDSGGDACTYGYYEKQDLARLLDTVRAAPIVLVGTSLGGAVALQAAALDRRVAAVVAAETFSDLRTVATERAPAFMPTGLVRRSFVEAEREALFDVDAVSPVAAARQIAIPVLLLHGAGDVDTTPDHSRRVFEALAGPKKLILVPGAGHNHALSPDTWPEVERWIERGATSSATPR